MDENKLRMTISTEASGFKIEIQIDSLDHLEDAYLLLLDAKAHLRAIEQKHKVRQIAENCKEGASRFWIRVEGRNRIQGVDDTPIGMMLSLLDAYPETKQVGLIASEVGVSQPAVSRYLSGSLGNHTVYFEECDKGWKLSDEGVLHLAEWLDVS